MRGPNLFLEYLNRPDATAETVRDGWFHTGDLATRAPDGYVRIVGRRATDLIKSGGFKIGAGEIEGALLEHEAVAEVAVTGAPDPDLGERIVAWVVPAEGSLAEPRRAHRPRRPPAHAAQAPTRDPLRGRASAQRDGQGGQDAARRLSLVGAWTSGTMRGVDPVRIFVGLPQLLDQEAPDVVARYAVRAEAIGFAGLWTLDAVPGSATSRVPLLEGLHVLTTAAAVTDTIGLGIAVIVLPARNAAGARARARDGRSAERRPAHRRRRRRAQGADGGRARVADGAPRPPPGGGRRGPTRASGPTARPPTTASTTASRA